MTTGPDLRTDAGIAPPENAALGQTPSPPAGPPPGGERRRASWREFRHAYPGILVTLTLAIAMMVALDAWLIAKMVRYRGEVRRLRGNMTVAERRRTDLLLESEENKFRVMIELIRRQARGDKQLNLAVSVDSGLMYLGREGAVLRQMRVEIGPEKTVGTSPDTVRMTPPRGQRTVERLVGAGDEWDVPAWVYTERGLAVPAKRTAKGALGPTAIIVTGGTVIYSMPQSGPLADSAWVMPGSIRASASDLRAIAPNVERGMSIYFY